MRKLVSALLIAAMVATSVTAMAEGETPESSAVTITTPSASDRADIKITGITGTPTVTLYQIAKGIYGSDDKEFIGYDWAYGVEGEISNVNEITADEIAVIANNIMNGSISANPTDTEDFVVIQVNQQTSVESTYTYNAAAGAYIAIITGASDGIVYNPILLSASYNSTGAFEGGEVDAADTYLYGTTAVAKKTTPNIDKAVAGTTDDTDGSSNTINTASVGDVLTYTLTPTMPSYPVGAVNKTFFISDTMSDGLTFLFDSLTVSITGTDAPTVTKSGSATDGYTFTIGEGSAAVEIAKATAITSGNKVTGFDLCFDYDKLISNTTTGAVYTPGISYNAVVNESAIVGSTGNVNNAVLYYANEPNNGTTWDDASDKTDNAAGVTSKTDSETVYTYQLAFLKTGEDSNDEGTDPDPLADAVFGIYAEEGCSTLIDVVKTNAAGYAVSTNVAAGTYYIKEIAAPTGYSLNTEVYDIEASWTSAVTTATSTDRTWTTTAPATDAKQIGWAIDGVFYAMDEFTTETAEAAGAVPAYLESETITTVTEVTGSTAGSGTVLKTASIPNTKLSALPSTGGIGTYLFTIVGVAVMAAMALMFLRGRKEEE